MKRLHFHITSAYYNKQKMTPAKAKSYPQAISQHWRQKEYITSFQRKVKKMGQNNGSDIKMALNL